jgi:anti-sigma regulatory factor (Ser/Thr protein kinase)
MEEGAVATAQALKNVRWTKKYPGTADTVREVRHDVNEIIGPCPEAIAEDIVLVVSELATNAIRHSRSGEDGGTYAVRISHCVTEKIPYVWIEVQDQGSPSWDGTVRAEPTHGLSVVQGLSTLLGSEDGPKGQRTVYARLQYRADGTPLYGGGPVPEIPSDLVGVRESDANAREEGE